MAGGEGGGGGGAQREGSCDLQHNLLEGGGHCGLISSVLSLI